MQTQLLRLLASLHPRWTLTGGAALAGLHLGHRVTRDLDLFWHQLAELGDLPDQVGDALRSAELDVSRIQRTPSHCRLLVTGASETVLVDLVADPTPTIESPVEFEVGGVRLLVDTRHEILVNKLCALLGRMEPRDLVDIRALLVSGEDLMRAIRDAPSKDSGFSPVTLGWVLRSFPVRSLAEAAGWNAEEAAVLERFRDHLIDQLVQESFPPETSGTL